MNISLNWLSKESAYPIENFIPVDRNRLLAVEGQRKYEVLAELAACMCIRNDIMAILNDGTIGTDIIILSRKKLEKEMSGRLEAVFRVLDANSAIRKDVTSYTDDIPFSTAVEIEMRKTTAEKNSEEFFSAA